MRICAGQVQLEPVPPVADAGRFQVGAIAVRMHARDHAVAVQHLQPHRIRRPIRMERPAGHARAIDAVQPPFQPPGRRAGFRQFDAGAPVDRALDRRQPLAALHARRAEPPVRRRVARIQRVEFRRVVEHRAAVAIDERLGRARPRRRSRRALPVRYGNSGSDRSPARGGCCCRSPNARPAPARRRSTSRAAAKRSGRASASRHPARPAAIRIGITSRWPVGMRAGIAAPADPFDRLRAAVAASSRGRRCTAPPPASRRARSGCACRPGSRARCSRSAPCSPPAAARWK